METIFFSKYNYNIQPFINTCTCNKIYRNLLTMAMVLKNQLNNDSLQREPDIKNLPPLPSDKWPEYMLDNQDTLRDERRAIQGLDDYFKKSEQNGYSQSQPYAPMFTGKDMAVDQAAKNNTYMKLIFGGKPDPLTDNIDLAYNHSLRQLAEAPVSKDSLLGHENPLEIVEAEQATKDSLLRTFEEQRRFYAGTVDTDTERFLKADPHTNLL